MARLLPIVIIICFSCSAGNNSTQTKANKLIDSLFTPEFQTTYMERTVEELLVEIEKKADSSTDFDKLYEFVLLNDRYGFRALPLLVSIKHEQLPNFIVENSSVLYGYQTLCETLNWRYSDIDSATHHAFNTTIIDVLLSTISKLEDPTIRRNIYELVEDIGTYKQVKKFHELFAQETDRNSRIEILRALLRFKDSANDSIVLNEFTNHFDYNIFFYTLESGFQGYGRHDFLPFLYSIKKNLRNETDTRKVGRAKKVLKEITKVIKNLEKKKKEGVRPGLPLDWGVVSE